MSEFELLVIPLSIILALGVTRILEGLIHAIRHRERSRLHWLPIAWAGYVFMYVMTSFNMLWEINLANEAWTWPTFGMQLVHAVLLFSAAGLLSASDAMYVELGMLENFERHGRLALIPLVIMFAVAIPFNKWGGGPDWVSLPNLLNVILLVLTTWTFRAPRRLRAWPTIAFGAVSAFGWFLVFARPGDG